MKYFNAKLAALALAGSLATAGMAEENVMVVFDGSNSMWGQIDGVAKIEIARDVMQNLLGEWTKDRQVGLMAYGHRRRGDCSDIETLVAPGKGTREEILSRINAITPTGKTPLTDAIEQAAIQLSYTDQPATVVLISDGLESCGRDPCALAAALEKAGVGFTAHVVGFGLSGDADAASLSCIAENTGGKYISASNAAELGQALSDVAQAVAEAPAPKPVPEPVPDAPKVALTVPETAIAGSEITVGWSPTIAERDYVTIVPVGSKEGTYETYVTVGTETEGLLTMPAFAGQYEARYVLNETGETQGVETIEIIDPDITLTGPDSVTAGALFDISWQNGVNRRDYITIVPVGADEGTYESYFTVEDFSEGLLTAAPEPGLYELRYVLNQGARTVARRAIEVTEAKVTLDAPATVQAGEEFNLSWQGRVNKRDFVTIVPMGADEGSYESYFTVGDNSEGALTAAAQPGLYELRYVLFQGARTVARQAIEVVEVEVTLQGPATVQTGEEFKLSWQGRVNKRDFVTIVPVGADEGTYESYFTVGDNDKGVLTAAAQPGLYELRYVLYQGARTVARQAIEVAEATVTLSGPEAALAGSAFDVSWAGAVGKSDYITIVPMGADEGTYGNYFVVQDKSKDELRAPADPGLYELRYILREGNKTMARQPIEITEPEVTISGPDTALAGSKIDVSWTGEVDKGDYITIVPMGTDEGTYGNYFATRGAGKNSLQAPSEPGLYELRYVLREGARTMARAAIEITEPEVTVSGPDTALAGSRVEVSWTGAVAHNDYVTIVPMGSDEGTFGSYKTLRNETKTDLKAPADPGIYEIRYILREGSKTLARQMIEITEPEVSLEAPNEIRAGDKLRVGWSGTVADDDYIALVPMGTADNEFGNYLIVRDKSGADIKAPDETGLYELRYILREGGRVLARVPVEVLAADAALEAGASLSAPDTAAPGAVIEVNWQASSDSADQRITLARGNQPIFTWLQAVKITGDGPVEITLPNEPGVYELRFLDLSNQAVLSRKVITVK